MTRPDSYTDQVPARMCGNCQHCYHVKWIDMLLCFNGEHVLATRGKDSPNGSDCVDLLNLPEFERSVELMDGDQLSQIWGKNSVDAHGICSEWEPRRDE